jgi:copper chaperone CopZ
MRPLPVLLAAACAASLLAGCAAAPTSDSAKKFKGDQQAVAKVVDDLSTAATKSDGKRICTSILAPALAQRLPSGTRDCAKVIEDQLSDADAGALTIDVKSVQVSGDTATAKVQSTVSGKDAIQTLRFARDGRAWRIAGLG